jgi:hypothetical protein
MPIVMRARGATDLSVISPAAATRKRPDKANDD